MKKLLLAGLILLCTTPHRADAFFEQLPFEIQHYIMKYLDQKHRNIVAQVSRSNRNLIDACGIRIFKLDQFKRLPLKKISKISFFDTDDLDWDDPKTSDIINAISEMHDLAILTLKIKKIDKTTEKYVPIDEITAQNLIQALRNKYKLEIALFMGSPYLATHQNSIRDIIYESSPKCFVAWRSPSSGIAP